MTDLDNKNISVTVERKSLGSIDCCVTASLIDDPYKYNCYGFANYEEGSVLYNLFKLGNSPDMQLKEATHRAIKNLKEKYNAREAKRISDKDLTEKAKSFINDCK